MSERTRRVEGRARARGSEELRRRALAGSSRVRILQALRDEGPLDADALAERVGLHRNTVRAHLGVLERAGLVERETERSGRPGRPRVRYLAAPEQETGYLLLSRILSEQLARSRARVADRMVEAGRAWGRSEMAARSSSADRREGVEAVEAVASLLDALGFAPEVRRGRGGVRVLLHACPFRQVAEEHPEIVCSVHLGLIRGALEAAGARSLRTDLEPFVEPELCVAHVRGDAR